MPARPGRLLHPIAQLVVIAEYSASSRSLPSRAGMSTRRERASIQQPRHRAGLEAIGPGRLADRPDRIVVAAKEPAVRRRLTSGWRVIS